MHVSDIPLWDFFLPSRGCVFAARWKSRNDSFAFRELCCQMEALYKVQQSVGHDCAAVCPSASHGGKQSCSIQRAEMKLIVKNNIRCPLDPLLVIFILYLLILCSSPITGELCCHFLPYPVPLFSQAAFSRLSGHSRPFVCSR